MGRRDYSLSIYDECIHLKQRKGLAVDFPLYKLGKGLLFKSVFDVLFINPFIGVESNLVYFTGEKRTTNMSLITSWIIQLV